MPIVIAPEEMQAIETTGYGLHGDIGGIAKTTYWTPDGRRIRAIPCMIAFTIKKDGKVVDSGTGDANIIEKGWLLQPPAKPKLFCQTCDRWHDTKAQIEACKKERAQLIGRATRLAKRERKDKTVDLETQVQNLSTQVEKLMAQLKEVQAGKILQSTDNEPTGQAPRQQGAGSSQGRV